MTTTWPSAFPIFIVSIGLQASAPASARNLVANGGFERPVVPVASPGLYRNGDEVDGWTVVGGKGNVALLNGEFKQLGLKFTSQQGVQSIDLTGLTNTDTGITQSIPTVAGARYDLSFHVGNVQAPDTAPWGRVSSVQVLLNGSPFATATHRGGPTDELGWLEFSYPFTAIGASTHITFINRDSPIDHVNQLDNVSIVAAVSRPGTSAGNADIAPPSQLAPDRTTPWILVVALLFAGSGLFYLHSFMRLYGIVLAERPDWLPRGRASSIMAVHGAAFGSQVHQLGSPMAIVYAGRLRVLLPLGIALFAVVVLWPFVFPDH